MGDFLSYDTINAAQYSVLAPANFTSIISLEISGWNCPVLRVERWAVAAVVKVVVDGRWWSGQVSWGRAGREDNNGINHKHRWTGGALCWWQDRNIIPGFLFVFIICFIVPPLSRNRKTFLWTRLCRSLWLPWIVMSLLILLTSQHWGIFPRPRPELGVKVSTSISRDYRPWRRDLIKQRNKQT